MVSREQKSRSLAIEIEKEELHDKSKKRVVKLGMFFLIVIILLVSLFCYMRFVSTKGLVVREYKIVNEKLPESFHGFKVVHFSDLHYLSTFDKSDLKKMITAINKAKPDIVVFTGDLTDQNTKVTSNDLTDLVELFNKIQVTTGLYAVRGNHDYINNNFDVVFNQTDFKILDNNYDLIYHRGTTPILITGVGSKIQGDLDIGKAYSYNETDSIFTISLLHEPDYIDEVIKTNKVDLAVAGHSHNGQIRIPGVGAIQKISGAKKYPNLYYKISDTDLFVSGGLGTSNLKLRFFNRPSINLYRLVEK